MAARRSPSLTPHSFYVLVALSDEDRHGSGIVREVLQITAGDVRLWPVKLYSTLDEMTAAGWTEELAATGEHPEGKSRKRRYYRITEVGREMLAAETERLQGLVSVARERNDGRRSTAGER